MCVIILVNDQRPSEKLIEKAFAKNVDGASIAYREKGKVVWSKDLTLIHLQHLAETVPLPYVLFMRVATIGGKSPELTAPFEISEDPSIELDGVTDKWVFFHNGTYKDWAEDCRKFSHATGVPVPDGLWSDSRAIAWMMSVYGVGFMQFFPEHRGVAFGPGPDDLRILTGPGWEEVQDGPNKIWCSNNRFTFGLVDRGGAVDHGGYLSKVCRWGQCKSNDVDKEGYCPLHTGGIARAYAKPVTGAGGTQQAAIPFPKALPQGEILKLEVAQEALKDKRITPQDFKVVKRAHKDLLKGGKRTRKALKKLILAALSPVYKSNVSGRVH